MIRPVHASGRQHGIRVKWASWKGRERRDRPRGAGANDCQRGRTNPARKIGAIERVREKEAQRADDAVHRWRRDACLLLFDLELPDILGARGVGRAPEQAREPPDVAKIITLRLLRAAPHGHIVDQALAHRADRANLDKLVHRSNPQVEERKESA